MKKGCWLWLDFERIFKYSFTVCWLIRNDNNNNNKFDLSLFNVKSDD